MVQLEIIDSSLLSDYSQRIKEDIHAAFQSLTEIPLDSRSFNFYTSVAAISSSRIEGEAMDEDSYVKYKTLDIEYLPELVKKPDDLFDAYVFARNNALNETAFQQAHAIITRHLLPERSRGAYRNRAMVVLQHNTGRIQYEAAPAAIVQDEMKKLWNDIKGLMQQPLELHEVLYYASMVHLVFVNIHPYNDGNGRAARLLEKWFIAQNTGRQAWYIPSEKYYYQHVDEYYASLARVGMFYEELDYKKAEKFLLLLPEALKV